MIAVTATEEAQIKIVFEQNGYPLQALFFQNVGDNRYVEILFPMSLKQRKEAEELVMNIIFQKQAESAIAQV